MRALGVPQILCVRVALGLLANTVGVPTRAQRRDRALVALRAGLGAGLVEVLGWRRGLLVESVAG